MSSDDNRPSENNFAIKLEGVSKCFQIYDQPHHRLLQGVFRGKKQYFKEFWALQDISFEVRKGETLGVIGRNGAGKSTLLQIICGTLAQTSGSVNVNGRVAALLELGAGFNPEFTGRENVYMNAAVLGLSKEETETRFDDILAFANIGEFIDQSVKTYSSGMMMRLAFAIIAHVDADILIVDEALAVGDAFFTQKCMRFLRTFMKKGTVLFVSHDTGSVVNLCSKAILLNHGQVIEIGSPKNVTTHYLESLYESKQEIGGIETSTSNVLIDQVKYSNEYRDMRETLINGSTLRNDIEIFQFNPDQSGFGTGESKITDVRLFDQDEIALSWVVGGEGVVLEVRCLAHKQMLQPIVGFQFKDRLGQIIFADNTFLSYKNSPQSVAQGSELIARFDFRLPILPTGDYAISVAIAEGSQVSHVQHHWMHDALIVRVHASSIPFGLVGIPMRKITLETV